MFKANHFKSRSKFRNVKTTLKGISFDSKKEANRYNELSILAKKGLIKNLETQKRFKLIVNDVLICTYIADFVYDNSKGETVVEDVKGYITDVFKLKKKMMKAILGIEVLII